MKRHIKRVRLGRKSGYFKRWLEYSNEYGKLNIVLLSWKRTCWTSLIPKTKNVLWTLFMLDTELRYGKLIVPKTPWTPQTMTVNCFKESFISWTNWIKRKLNSMQSKELFASSSGLLTLQRATRYSKKQNIHMPGIEKGLLILD